jgi:hypothetical protein
MDFCHVWDRPRSFRGAIANFWASNRNTDLPPRIEMTLSTIFRKNAVSGELFFVEVDKSPPRRAWVEQAFTRRRIVRRELGA